MQGKWLKCEVTCCYDELDKYCYAEEKTLIAAIVVIVAIDSVIMQFQTQKQIYGKNAEKIYV